MAYKKLKPSHPGWAYSANIYEVNLRQYTPEGTFEAFAGSLPRLKDMGIRILWFMPVTPISLKDRLGTLGSYYSVKDYTSTNPEFGSIGDFKTLVSQAHELGLKVIVDFIADHTGNDHAWIQEHPEFYLWGDNNEPNHPHGWHDVSQLNYNEPELWRYMIDVLKFWVTECDVDGYRCDMAHLVPLPFWIQARKKLSKVKENLFWLGECEEPEYHQVFDATYTWRWMHASQEFYHQKMNLHSLLTVLYKSVTEFPANAFRMYFTSNHDENSWNGTEFEKYGEAAKLLSVFSCTWDGIPLIYSGQELPNRKRLKFFDKDVIAWDGNYELHEFYKTLLTLRSNNKCLQAGNTDVLTKIVSHPEDPRVFSYLRKQKKSEVLVVLNFSGDEFDFQVKNVTGIFRNVFGGDDINFATNDQVFLHAWGFLVFERVFMLS
jgi:glycosidase